MNCAPTPYDIVLSFRSGKAELALLRSDRRHGFRLQCYVQVDGVMERVRDRRPQRRMPNECLKCLTRCVRLQPNRHADRIEPDRLRRGIAHPLALQLQLPFQVGLVGFGLVAAAPDGPGDDESRLDPALG